MNPVVHFEMPYDDAQRIARFYQAAFDWQAKPLGPDMGNYVLATTVIDDATPEDIAKVRAAYGLDKSMAEQFVIFLREAKTQTFFCTSVFIER